MNQVELTPWHNGLLMELLLTVPVDGSWEEARSHISGCLEAHKATYVGRGAIVTVDIANRAISADEILAMQDLLLAQFGLQLISLVCTDRSAQAAAKELGITNYMLPPGSKVDTAVAATPLSGSNALYVTSTVRSGQRVVHGGHIVISGDVNSGAEIIATGDIMVFGTLRGLAHAGCQGDENSRIVAGSMRPQQLRIASQIARAPENNEKDARRPEVARIENGAIQVFPA